MDAAELMDDVADEHEWTTERQLELVLQFIDNRRDHDAFEEFLEHASRAEKNTYGAD
jgi:hypothetical protein